MPVAGGPPPAAPSVSYSIREQEEVRGLLVISDTLGLPLEFQAWYWGLVRGYLSSSPTSAMRLQCATPASLTLSGWAFSCYWRSLSCPPHPVGVWPGQLGGVGGPPACWGCAPAQEGIGSTRTEVQGLALPTFTDLENMVKGMPRMKHSF